MKKILIFILMLFILNFSVYATTINIINNEIVADNINYQQTSYGQRFLILNNYNTTTIRGEDFSQRALIRYSLDANYF